MMENGDYFFQSLRWRLPNYPLPFMSQNMGARCIMLARQFELHELRPNMLQIFDWNDLANNYFNRSDFRPENVWAFTHVYVILTLDHLLRLRGQLLS